MIRQRSWTVRTLGLAAAVLAGGLACPLLLAGPGKVVTRQGQTFEGEVTDNRARGGDVEVVDANGRKITLKRGNVASVEANETPPADGDAPIAADAPPGAGAAPAPGPAEAELRNRLSSLARNDVNGRLRLARNAFNRREYAVATEALEQALQLDPRNEEARALLDTVDAQRRLDQRPRPEPAPRERPAAGANGADGRGGGSGAMPPLHPDDINRIRQREWTRNDRNVRVRFIGDVKRQFVARSRNNIRPADFNNLNAVEQGWQIVGDGDEEMRNAVRLTTDPASLAAYRTIVQRAILPTCATVACHGGGQGGAFQLHPRADREGEAYANFLTLSTYTYSPKRAQPAPPPPGPAAAPGTPPAASRNVAARAPRYYMIDRDRPADSLLIQFALPQNLADTPHPDVPGFKPVFRTLKDPRYDQFLRWISNDLAPLQRDYGIQINRGADVAGAAQPAQPQPGGPPLQPGQQPVQPPGQQPNQPGGQRPGQPPPPPPPGQRQPGPPAQGQRPAPPPR